MSGQVTMWVSALAFALGVVAVAWTIVRDRSLLGKLERVTSIASQLDSESRVHTMMRDVRDRLAVQVALASEAPTHPRRLVTGWALLVLGFSAGVGWWTFAITVAGPMAWIHAAVWGPYAIGVAIGFAGQGVLVFRNLAITSWKDTRFL